MNRQALNRLQRRRRRNSRGMTLIEIHVVLAIIAMIMGGVAVVAFNAFSGAQVDNTYIEVVKIQGHVERYRMQKNKCPTGMADLKTAGIITKVSKDAWGNDYQIKCPGENSAVDVTSYGPDGKPGGNDDINSWEDPKELDAKKNEGK
jgi:general secretion pathway protein G